MTSISREPAAAPAERPHPPIDTLVRDQSMSDIAAYHQRAHELGHARTYPMLGEPLPQARLSIELFPPRSGPASESFFTEVGRLAAVAPEYFSVTSGAGGGEQVEATLATVQDVKGRFERPGGAASDRCRPHARPGRSAGGALHRDGDQARGGVARRFRRRTRPGVPAARRRLCARRRSGAQPAAGRQLQDRRRLPSGDPSRSCERRCRSAAPQGQGRCRCLGADHPVLLRYRPDPAVPRCVCRERDRRTDRSWHHADPRVRPDQAVQRDVRCHDPGCGWKTCSGVWTSNRSWHGWSPPRSQPNNAGG